MADFPPSPVAVADGGGTGRRTTWPGAIDWLVAAMIGLFALTEELRSPADVPDRPVLAWWLGGALLTAFLVLVRRRFPVAALCVFTGANLAVFLLAHQPPGAWQWYTQALLLFTLLTTVPPRSPHGGAGVVVRRHGPRADQADARNQAPAARSEPAARESAARERARIARELHDIIAHSMSVMVMQAGGVRLTLPQERRREREALAVIEETGRGAVDELNRMLGLLRAPERDETVPQPTLDRLAELAAHVRSAGLDVALQIEGTPRPLPAGLEVSSYRIAEEALTNVLKHAGPTEVLVTVTHGDTELCLEIVDEGPRDRRAGAVVRSGGNGLTGVRERVALFNGDLHAGPREGGGYRLHAVLPLPVRSWPVRPS